MFHRHWPVLAGLPSTPRDEPMKKALVSLISCLFLVSLTAPALAMRDGHTAQGEPFVTGGIGAEEREALAAQRGAFNLRILTAAKGSGAYLSAVQARISDSAGRLVLETVTDGPWLYVRLQPGAYVVQLLYKGQPQQQGLTLGQQEQRQLGFYFDEVVERLPPGETP
jgi:hypothetical protein